MIKVRYSLLSVFKGQDNIFQSYLSPNKPQISFYHSSTKSCNLWKHLRAWAVKDGLFLHDLPHRYCLIQELQKNSTWCSLPTYSFTLLAAQWVRCSLQPNPWQSTLLIFVTFTIASEFPPSFFFFFSSYLHLIPSSLLHALFGKWTTPEKLQNLMFLKGFSLLPCFSAIVFPESKATPRIANSKCNCWRCSEKHSLYCILSKVPHCCVSIFPIPFQVILLLHPFLSYFLSWFTTV